MTSFYPACLAVIVLAMCAAPVLAAERLTFNFNPDWRFMKDDPAGAEAPGFDDRGWALVSTPHTFNDIDTFDNWSTPGHRGEQIQWSGRAWYRKTFAAPSEWAGKKVFIEFEAARQIAEVYLNGTRLGVAKTGFTPFGFDLTPHLKVGASNVLAVMTDNRFMRDPLDPVTAAEIERMNASGSTAPTLSSAANPNLRSLHEEINKGIPEKLGDLQADQIPWNNPHWHPAHGGLYRNVRLIVTDPLHISLPLYSFLETVGPYAYARTVTTEKAEVTVEIPVRNGRPTDQTMEALVDITDASGRSVLTLRESRRMGAGEQAEFKLTSSLPRPRLWEPAYPHLYRVVCTLRVGAETVDTSEIPLGIRAVRFDTARGFFINGQNLKLRGWGQKSTNEWPGLGAALPDWLQFHTLELMRQAGGNFVRWGHTAGGPAQIAAADRLGIIVDQPGVDGEADTLRAAWELRASAFRDIIIYFRNHPSILAWEGGNQKISREHAKELRGLMDRYDPHGGRAYTHRRADQITAEFMDIGIGTEGGREIARLPVIEGEYNREEAPRRVWDHASPPNFGYPEAKGQTYELTSEQFAANQVSQYVKKLGSPEHSGGANWIFSDSTSGGRVAVEVARASGEVDAARLPKEAYWVCAAMWRDEPQVHVIGHWTYPAGTTKNVHVVSNAESVELFVNGQSVGPGVVSDKHLFTFADVSYAPGEIKAVATTAGKIVAIQSKRTAGPPVGLKLTAITAPGGLRADGSDIALFDVEVVDAQGNRHPTSKSRVDFETEGPAVFRGGYNSGRIGSINHTVLDLEAGINRVAIRATRNAGRVTLRAKSEALRPASLTITSTPFSATGGLAKAAPVFQTVALASAPPPRSFDASWARPPRPAFAESPAGPGRFIRAFNYTGPSSPIVHVESDAQNGRKVYVDRDSVFATLPAELHGADWVQIAASDQRYSAVDLIEIAAAPNTVVTIAHDDRAPLPAWLTRQFTPTARTLTVDGVVMRLFEQAMDAGGSLTFGSNTDGAPVTANHYIVFLNGR